MALLFAKYAREVAKALPSDKAYPLRGRKNARRARRNGDTTEAFVLCCSVIVVTKIPLDARLPRLVMADPAIEVIERDIALSHIWNWLNLTIAAGAEVRRSRATPHRAVGEW
jgi:hypothetical protein